MLTNPPVIPVKTGICGTDIHNLTGNIAYYLLFGVIASLACSISFFEVTSILFMLTAVVSMMLSRDKWIFRGQWTIFFIIYFSANLISLTQTQYPFESLKGIFRVFRLILLCLSVIYVVNSEDRFKKIYFFCLWVAVVIGIDGLIQGASGFELIRQRQVTPYVGDARRITATFAHANDFSAYLSLLFFFSLGLLTEFRSLKLSRRTVGFLAFGCAVLVAALFWTYSRGAWVGVAASFFLLAVLKKRKALLICLAGLILWSVFLSPPLIRDRAHSLWRPADNTMTERKILTQESLDMINKSPWFGMGINTFSRNAPFYKSDLGYTGAKYTHNGYLQIAVETGITGLLSFLLFFAYFFVVYIPFFVKRSGCFLAAGGLSIVFGVLAFMMQSSVDTNLQSLLLVSNLWFCLGLALAAVNIMRKPSAR